MSFRNDCWSRTPDLRVRPVYEMETCIVFTPSNPTLYSLNSTAWLVFELCDGRSWQRLEKAYYAAVEPLRSREEARRELISTLEDLTQKGILNHHQALPSSGGPARRPGRERRGGEAI